MSAKTRETRRKLEWRSASRDHRAPSASAPAAAVTVLAAADAAEAAASGAVAHARLEGEPISVEFARLFGVKLLQWKKPVPSPCKLQQDGRRRVQTTPLK